MKETVTNRPTKPTDKPTDEKEHRSDDITYTQAGVYVLRRTGK
jgi:hypothetical protein